MINDDIKNTGMKIILFNMSGNILQKPENIFSSGEYRIQQIAAFSVVSVTS